jgi:hypothetical protein
MAVRRVARSEEYAAGVGGVAVAHMPLIVARGAAGGQIRLEVSSVVHTVTGILRPGVTGYNGVANRR